MTQIFSRNPSWLKWFVIAWVSVVWISTLFIGWDVRDKLTCKFTDFRSELNVAHSNRGYATACLARQYPDQIAKYVPQLLTLLSDDSIYTQNLGLVGEYKRTVADRAADAIQQATPQADNVEPIMRTLVEFAGTLERSGGKTDFAKRTNRAYVFMLADLLTDKYVQAGLTQSVMAAFVAHADQITSDAFWRYRPNEYGQGYAHRVDKLSAGKSMMAAAQYAKHQAEQAAESAVPPRIPPLREISLPTPPTTPAQASAAAETNAKKYGSTGSLRKDPERMTDGWATVYVDHSSISCNESLPVLCIGKPEINDAALSWEGLERLGVLTAAVDARVALSSPVIGMRLNTPNVGDAICKEQHGANWRMTRYSDSLVESLPPNSWRLARFHRDRGGTVSVRASEQQRSAMMATDFWVASGRADESCW
jgi:hypothetical protein